MSSNSTKVLVQLTDSKEYSSILGGSYPSQLYLDQIIIRGESADLEFYAPIGDMIVPERWRNRCYDHFRFELCLFEISSLIIENFSIGELVTIKEYAKTLEIKKESGCRMLISFGKAFLMNVEGYENGNE